KYADKLQFFDRDGAPASEGINVGDEWGYRGSVEGGTLSAADFHFSGLDKSLADANGDLKLQLNLGVFRTIKGNIEKPVKGYLQLIHPDDNFISVKILFDCNEFELQEMVVLKVVRGHSKQP